MNHFVKWVIASTFAVTFASEVHAACVSVPEWQTANISCPSGQTVSSIRFASYGTATGSCGAYATSSCNATTSKSVISNACLGRANCSVVASNSVFGDPCGGTFKSLKVDYACAAPVVISPTPTCGRITEGQRLNLACPTGQTISKIVFASYGTSTGSCGSLVTSGCHAANSGTIVSSACLGKANCSVLAANSVFGDPCSGTVKSLTAQVQCSGTVSPPPPAPSPTPSPTPTTKSGTITEPITGKAYYLSPSGNDSGTGSLSSPWFTLNKAWSVVRGGDVIYLRGGTYRYSSQQNLHNKSGSAGSTIKIWAYPGEKPVVTPSSSYSGKRGIDLWYANYVHIKGLEISGFVQKSSTSFYYGIAAQNSSFNTFENLNVHDNGFGLSIGSDSGDNLVLNSDFHRNADPLTNLDGNIAWGGADGITIRTSDPNRTNTIRGCRMWWNSDDGVDLFNNEGTIIIENSWAFWNGYRPGTFTKAGDGNGLKIGPTRTDQSTKVRRILRNNLVFQNRMRGVDQNNNRSITLLYNNTAYDNGYTGDPARGFDFWNGYAATIAKNNVDFGEAMGCRFNDQAVLSHNTFRRDASLDSNYFVTASDFLSLDTAGVIGPRQSNGSMPNLNFLKLAPGSDLINRGTNVGLPFSGTAPDLGAFETN